MKKFLATLFLMAGITAAQAQVTGNVGVTSDYRFRGVSQTQNAPAVQGGFDYAHSSGFYVGNWNSSVSSLVYTNGAGLESDLYAGWKKEIYKGLTVDVGSYNYLYPRATNNTSSDFNTYELFAGLSYGPVSVKYSESLSNYFGVDNSKNSSYTQADLNLPITAKISVLAHAGRTNVKNSDSLNYTDYNVGFGYKLPDNFELAVRYYTNDNEGSAFQSTNLVNGQKNYKNTTAVSLTKTF